MPIRRRQTGATDSLSISYASLRVKRPSRTKEEFFPRPPPSKIDINKCAAESPKSSPMESSQINGNFHQSSNGWSQNNQWDQWGWGHLNYYHSDVQCGQPEDCTDQGNSSEKISVNSQCSYTERTEFNHGYCDHKGASVSLISESEGVYYYSCFLCGNSGYYNQYGNIQYNESNKFYSSEQSLAVNLHNGTSTYFSLGDKYDRSLENAWNENTSKIPETLPLETSETSTVEQNSSYVDINSEQSPAVHDSISHKYLDFAEPTEQFSKNLTDQNILDMTKWPPEQKLNQSLSTPVQKNDNPGETVSVAWDTQSQMKFNASTGHVLCSDDVTISNQEPVQSYTSRTDEFVQSQNSAQNGASHSDANLYSSRNNNMTAYFQAEKHSDLSSVENCREKDNIMTLKSQDWSNASWNNGFNDAWDQNGYFADSPDSLAKAQENNDVLQFDSREKYESHWNIDERTNAWNEIDFNDPIVPENSFSSKDKEINIIPNDSDFPTKVENDSRTSDRRQSPDTAHHNVSSKFEEIFDNFHDKSTDVTVPRENAESKHSTQNETPSFDLNEDKESNADIWNTNFSAVNQDESEVEALNGHIASEKLEEVQEAPSTSHEDYDETVDCDFSLNERNEETEATFSSISERVVENVFDEISASNNDCDLLQTSGTSDVNCWSPNAWNPWTEDAETDWNNVEEKQVVADSTNESYCFENLKLYKKSPRSSFECDDKSILSETVNNDEDIENLTLETENGRRPQSCTAESIENTPIDSDGIVVEESVSKQQQDLNERQNDLEDKNAPSGENNEPVEMTVHDCISMYSECLHNRRTVTDVYNERIWYLQSYPKSVAELAESKKTVEEIQDNSELSTVQHDLNADVKIVSNEVERNEDVPETCEEYRVHSGFNENEIQVNILNEALGENNPVEITTLDHENDPHERQIENGISIAGGDTFQTWDSNNWNEEVEIAALEMSPSNHDNTVEEIDTGTNPSENIFDPKSKESDLSTIRSLGLGILSDKTDTVNELDLLENGESEMNLAEKGWNTWDDQFESSEQNHVISTEEPTFSIPREDVGIIEVTVPETKPLDPEFDECFQLEKQPEIEKPYSEFGNLENNTVAELSCGEGWSTTWNNQLEEEWESNWNSTSEPACLGTCEESPSGANEEAQVDPEVNFGDIDFDNLENVNTWQFSQWSDMPDCAEGTIEDESAQPMPNESENQMTSQLHFPGAHSPAFDWDSEQKKWAPTEIDHEEKSQSVASTLCDTNVNQLPFEQDKLSCIPEPPASVSLLTATGTEEKFENADNGENLLHHGSKDESEGFQQIITEFESKSSDQLSQKMQEPVEIEGWNHDGWESSFEMNEIAEDVPISTQNSENFNVPEAHSSYEGRPENHFSESLNLESSLHVIEEPDDIESNNSQVDKQESHVLETFTESNIGENDVEVLKQAMNIDAGATKTDETRDGYFDVNATIFDNQWDDFGWGSGNEDTLEEPTAVETKMKTEKPSSEEKFLGNSDNFGVSFSQQSSHVLTSLSTQESQETPIQNSTGLDQPITPPTKTITEENIIEKPPAGGVSSVKLIDVKSLKVSPSYALRKTGKKPLSSLASSEESKLGKLDLSNSCFLEDTAAVAESDVNKSPSPVLPSLPVLDHRTTKAKKNHVDRSKLSKAAKVDILPDRAKLNASTAAIVDLEGTKSSLVAPIEEDIVPDETTDVIRVVDDEPKNHDNDLFNAVDHVPWNGSLEPHQLTYCENSVTELAPPHSLRSPDENSIDAESSTMPDTSQGNVEMTTSQNTVPTVNATAIQNPITANCVESHYNDNPSNTSFSSESTIHSVPNMNRSFPMYHHPPAPLNVDPYYNQNLLLNPYTSPDAVNQHTPIGMQPPYHMGAPFNMHFAVFEQMRILNWQQMQYKLYMDQLYVYMNKQKRLSKLKQIHNRRGRSKKNYDSCYTEDTATESAMSSDKDFTELETSSVETEDALDAVEHTKEHNVRIHSAKQQTQVLDAGKMNMRRRPHGCVARFSANGKFIFTDNLNAKASQLFFTTRVDPLPKAFGSFPGPLGRDRSQKLAVKEYLLKRLDEAELAGNKDLVTVLNYLVLLVKQNGAICGTDISEILLSEEPEGNYDQIIEDSVMDLPEASLNSTSINKLTHYASSGKDANLIRCASESNSWGMALRFAALTSDKELERHVHDSFDGKCSPDIPVNPMITFLLIKEKRKLPQVFLENCWRNWREHVAVILSNPTSNQEYDKACFEVIGDALTSKGLDIPAQFCYILACLPLSLPWEPNAKLALVGTSAKSPFTMMNDFESILLTLIFEYAVHLGNQEVCFPSIQFFKYHLASKMVEYGMKDKAIDFCLDACGEVSSNHVHFPTSFLSQLRDLVCQFAPGRNEQDEDALVFYLDQLDFLIDTRGNDNYHVASDRSHHSSNSNLLYDNEDSAAFPSKTPSHTVNHVKVSKPLSGFIEDISDSITLDPVIGNSEVVDSAIDTIQFPFNVSEEPMSQPHPPHVPSHPTHHTNQQQSSSYYQHQSVAVVQPSQEQPVVTNDSGPSSPKDTRKPHIPHQNAPFNVEIPKAESHPQPVLNQHEPVLQPPPPPVPFFGPSASFQKPAPVDDAPNSPKFTRNSIAKSNSSLNESDGHPGFARRKRDKSFRDSICSEASEASIFELSGRSRQAGHGSRVIHRGAERTQSVNSIESCKSLVYNTVIPETRSEAENSNISRNATPVNEPVKETPKPVKKDSLREQSKAWIFNGVRTVLTKIIPLPNQMHLPDDRSSDFYWDPEKKKWVDKTNDGKEDELPPPPPMAATIHSSNGLEKTASIAPIALSPLKESSLSLPKAVDSSDGPEKPPPPLPQPSGNPFARGKNIMRNKYVDVLASSNQVSSTAIPQLPPLLPNSFPPPLDENEAR